MSDVSSESNPAPGNRPVAWVTWILIGSTIAVFLLQLIELHLHSTDRIGDALAFGPQAFAGHHYWTLLTYAWIHAVTMAGTPYLFWVHIAINLAFIFFIGPPLEEYLGHGCFLGLYVGGVIAAALGCLFLDTDPAERIIGASGAASALMAGYGVATRHMGLKIMVAIICGVEVVQFAFRWMPQIAHSAHIGGALFGFLYVLVVRAISRRKLVYG